MRKIYKNIYVGSSIVKKPRTCTSACVIKFIAFFSKISLTGSVNGTLLAVR